MSKIRKRPWSHARFGDVHAQNVKAARLINNQDELDRIIDKQPDKAIAEGWLKEYGPHLKFVPQTFEEIQARLSPVPEMAE